MRASALQAIIRTRAIDSKKLIFTKHVSARMKERGITLTCIIEILTKGSIHRGPEPNLIKGSIECRMEYYCVGHNIGVVVALSDDDPNLIVVTAMHI
ncbi:DUF4258 domain-containing protein [Undibacterium sp. Di26W]|uniref:DUF4258 domain-containing protein n=1 Tax=Undibacterium sp. Di26W TaxID=3413035 RepID=UPI003BF20CBC